jgi:protein O-GlcNAc transferase
MMNVNEAIDLATRHHQEGKWEQAEKIYKEILKVEPNNFYALQYLGVLNIQYKHFDSAIQYIKKALQSKPDDSHAYYNLGIAFGGIGHLDEALICYQNAIRLNPANSDAYVNLGIIYKEKGALEYAALNFQNALQLNPNHFGAYNNLGIVLKEKGRLDEALICYQKAIAINPNYADIYLNLGVVLQARGKINEAVIYYQKALQLNPYHAEAYNSLGTVLMEQDKQDEAVLSFNKAIDCNPNFFAARFNHCLAQLPIIYEAETEIYECRRRYHDELLKLQDFIVLEDRQDIEIASKAIGAIQPFYLAYQNLNDRELQKIYGNFICKIMHLRYPQYAELLTMPSLFPDEPIRIGIVSGYFYNHSVWQIPIRGWIENLDKSRFNLYGYYTWSIKDNMTDHAKKCFTRFVEDVYSFDDLCQIIRNDNLHIIIYPEIGMDATTTRLAALRLAPVQCVSWGHPDTSGLPTIDYYLSSERMETHEADGHYTEQLVRLSNLSAFYIPTAASAAPVDRAAFGLKANSILYHCCQSLFKFLPQYDSVFPLIARQVENCQFLFSSHPKSALVSKKFRLRIKKEFSKFNLNVEDYVVFLPFLDRDQYNSLYALSDVFLDPIGWSGCNTAFEAIGWNLPIVTLPRFLMRSREASAILNMIGLSETVVADIDEYVAVSVKLGQNSTFREQLSQKIAGNKYLAYRDKACIIALENFLERVVKERLAP